MIYPRSKYPFVLLISVTSIFLLSCLPAAAQRLPDSIQPIHYNLVLTPDLKAAKFTGEETIDVQLLKPTSSIVLNAAEIEFQDVTAKLTGAPLPAKVSLDNDKEQATFTFPQTLPAGPVSLHVRYTGILNNQLRGFYLSKTPERNYAVTQFEATDARRAFPSFDEPQFKATFTVTLIVDTGDTAISNTNVVLDRPGPIAGKHAIKFGATPKMSTYLVAFLVGNFQCISGQSDGVPIRACATPDKVQLGQFALSAAEFTLHYYNTYFGIKYPLPKLDMIALPDFEAGAMENFGAITYRETALLIDSKTASTDAQKRVAIVVAHEMAHQWFGDLVTMQWWDNLWLNEGFATWMEHKPVAAWKPEWKISQDQAYELGETLNYDSQRTTRTIRAKADTPSEIGESFDGIAYGKAGAMLAMVEGYLGEDVFRKGVHNYLAGHLYGNATAEDFWIAQTRTSNKPVDKIMSSFVTQPGVPLLSFADPEKDRSAVTQQRFFLSADAKTGTAQSWTIPVCFLKASHQPGCELLSSAEQALPAPGGSLFFANAGGKGYYRTLYPADIYKQIASQAESVLKPEERISLLSDEWALTSSGRAKVSDYLNLVSSLSGDENSVVVDSAINGLVTIFNDVALKDDQQNLAAWTRQQFGPAYRKVQVAVPSEPVDRSELRATLFRVLGSTGQDPAIIADARQITDKWIQNPASVDTTLATAARSVATKYGDSQLFDRLVQVSKTSQDPVIRTGALYSLGNFRDPALVKRVLEYSVSGEVRNQDSVFLLTTPFAHDETREQAWQFVQQNWDKVQGQLTALSGSRIINAAGSFCSAAARDQVTQFFAVHKVNAAERALRQTTDRINDCAALQAQQEPDLKAWLAEHVKAKPAGGVE